MVDVAEIAFYLNSVIKWCARLNAKHALVSEMHAVGVVRPEEAGIRMNFDLMPSQEIRTRHNRKRGDNVCHGFARAVVAIWCIARDR